jgi:hypothetical protein
MLPPLHDPYSSSSSPHEGVVAAVTEKIRPGFRPVEELADDGGDCSAVAVDGET